MCVGLCGACKKGPPCARRADDSVVACIDNSPVTRIEVETSLRRLPRGRDKAELLDLRRLALEQTFRVRLFATEAVRRHLQAPERIAPAQRRAILSRKLVETLTKAQSQGEAAALDQLYERLRKGSRIEIFADALAAVGDP